MLSSPSNQLRKVKNGLLFFRKLQTDNSDNAKKYRAIANNAISSLKKIAALNAFNAKRVKNIYGIDIELPDNQP